MVTSSLQITEVRQVKSYNQYPSVQALLDLNHSRLLTLIQMENSLASNAAVESVPSWVMSLAGISV